MRGEVPGPALRGNLCAAGHDRAAAAEDLVQTRSGWQEGVHGPQDESWCLGAGAPELLLELKARSTYHIIYSNNMRWLYGIYI